MSRRQENARERARREAALAAERGATESSVADAPLDLQQFRARRVRARIGMLLEDLAVAIDRRDLQGVWDVLDEATAMRCFPPAVHEEALVLAHLSVKSHRAPITLYRFHEQLRRLGDEPLEWGDPAQLDLLRAGGPVDGPRRAPRSQAGSLSPRRR